VRTSVLILVGASLLLAACAQEECEQQAFVTSVEIEARDGEYYAIVEGTLQDACTQVSEITQQVDGKTIVVSICTTRPKDVLCAQILAPLEEEILLDTSDLSPGQYGVDVNGTVATLTIP
jgi:hypothetical protein